MDPPDNLDAQTAGALTLFPARLRALRQTHVGSQDALARLSGFSKASIQNWEGSAAKPGRAPNAQALCKLATIFGVSIDYLVGRTDLPLVAGDELTAGGLTARRSDPPLPSRGLRQPATGDALDRLRVDPPAAEDVA